MASEAGELGGVAAREWLVLHKLSVFFLPAFLAATQRGKMRGDGDGFTKKINIKYTQPINSWDLPGQMSGIASLGSSTSNSGILFLYKTKLEVHLHPISLIKDGKKGLLWWSSG